MKNSIVQYAINKKRKQVGKRGRMFTAAAGALMLGAMSLLTACKERHIIRDTVRHRSTSQSAESGAPEVRRPKAVTWKKRLRFLKKLQRTVMWVWYKRRTRACCLLSPMKRGNDRFYSYDAASSWTKGEAIAPLW